VRALQKANGIVESVSEAELTEAAMHADRTGLYVCPHTAVALASVAKQREAGVIQPGDSVVVVATAHGLKFTEFKVAQTHDRVPGAALGHAQLPREVPDDFDAVRAAALEEA